jgi:hypothetical protein
MNLSLDNLCLLKEENKLVSRDSKFPWCLSYCFWYAIVLQDVAMSIISVRICPSMLGGLKWCLDNIPHIYVVHSFMQGYLYQGNWEYSQVLSPGLIQANQARS